jgi:hypothetical protein
MMAVTKEIATQVPSFVDMEGTRPPTDVHIKEEMDRVFGAEEQEKEPVPRNMPRKYWRRSWVPSPPTGEQVNRPHHYAQYKIEPIHFMMENRVDPFQFNIIKYTMRHAEKNGLEDIKKVLRYTEMYLKFLSGDPKWSEASTMKIEGYVG